MQADFGDHPLFNQAKEFARTWLRPGSGAASSLGQITASPDGRRAAAAATVCDALEGFPSTRIALVDLTSGELEILTHGPNSDSAPKWSPDGRLIAYLSDREQTFINRLRILDVDGRKDHATPQVDGFVEFASWSPDGKTILIGVAGYGSDLAGAQGARTINLESDAVERPAWSPALEGLPEAAPWRGVWLYDLGSGSVRQVPTKGVNIWHAAWCGLDAIAAICSDGPEETWWYTADVRVIHLVSGVVRTVFKPKDHLGGLTVSPSGKTIAVIEAVCSDRDIVAGHVRLIDIASGAVVRPATLGADATHLYWRDEDQLLFTGARGPDNLIGLIDRRSNETTEVWRSSERTPSGMVFPEITPIGRDARDILFICESFFGAPVLVAIESGKEREICRLGSPETDRLVRTLGSARDFAWTAPDGLEIHGWLLTPSKPGPHPLIVHVHGGPVWYYRTQYIARSPLWQLALSQGYALLLPNPRGSSGRGQDFARCVFGDMGGADTYDYLSGLDALERAGLVDPRRIGVTGGSYGGFMTSWLITQSQRFAAAVSVAPVTDWVSEHLTSNVPTFCETFLDDQISNPRGKYHSRSPIHFADRVKTPTLNICGALDRITPPGQALEFHRAIRGAGVESLLLTYPQEGHGVRSMPANFDFVARTLTWFAKHMPAESDPKATGTIEAVS